MLINEWVLKAASLSAVAAARSTLSFDASVAASVQSVNLASRVAIDETVATVTSSAVMSPADAPDARLLNPAASPRQRTFQNRNSRADDSERDFSSNFLPHTPTESPVSSNRRQHHHKEGNNNRRTRSLRRARLLRESIVWSRSGHYLQILPDGTVNGTTELRPRYGVLEFIALSSVLTNWWSPRYVAHSEKLGIRGLVTQLWLCMSSTGRLYGSKERADECEFREMDLENFYTSYFSAKYPSQPSSTGAASLSSTSSSDPSDKKDRWFVAINHDGSARAMLTHRPKQKITQFLPRVVTNEIRPKSAGGRLKLTTSPADTATSMPPRVTEVDITIPTTTKLHTRKHHRLTSCSRHRRNRRRKGESDTSWKKRERRLRKKMRKACRKRKGKAPSIDGRGRSRKPSKSSRGDVRGNLSANSPNNLYKNIFMLLQTQSRNILIEKARRLRHSKKKSPLRLISSRQRKQGDGASFHIR